MSNIQIALAPMEGVADFHLRNLLTSRGGYAWCVSEFVRVSGQLLPTRVFRRICPELTQFAQTAAGVPVHVQLLGSCPVSLAENASRAVEAGAPVIDLNFGCPAKTVNRHCGGAVLLEDPDRIYSIVSSVRAGLPAEVPLTVKMRLGFNDKSLMLENARAVQQAGASWITVHARTKKDAYRVPAQWEDIGRINDSVSIPVVANGDIDSLAAWRKCREITGCTMFMIGRGAVKNPLLARCIMEEAEVGSIDLVAAKNLLLEYGGLIEGTGKSRHLASKMKQWMRILGENNEDIKDYFGVLKTEKEFSGVLEKIGNLTRPPDAAS